ncbi:16S rRNA (adenine(1518)-N(6)/adenine(1519)-N(6))-dimethyltransferase RsmA [Fodinicurvata halophila]|uniref:Ribosomal RNA small subunit methyltransferase A n=1 Tax=Fodinicurvata halophila TaxID=1419723 RepID=A0ABV8UL82_9PROT
MSCLESLPPLREVIARHELAARKSLGQNFLLDLNLTGRIARSAGPLGEGTIIEIGPGPGGLTRALLGAGAAHVIAVEKDHRCLKALEEIQAVSDGRLEVLAGDALEIPTSELGRPPRRIVANLPYNVATPLLISWLRAIARESGSLDRLILMFQKEVAQRITASPHSKPYGRLAVLAQWLCEAESLFDIAPTAFTPPPKVTSSLVRLIPRSHPLSPCPVEALEKVTAAAFGQRRKMLRQSLKSVFAKPTDILQELDLAETARAEELAIEDFCALARRFAEN